jgi:hypothetical protein
LGGRPGRRQYENPYLSHKFKYTDTFLMEKEFTVCLCGQPATEFNNSKPWSNIYYAFHYILPWVLLCKINFYVGETSGNLVLEYICTCHHIHIFLYLTVVKMKNKIWILLGFWNKLYHFLPKVIQSHL